MHATRRALRWSTKHTKDTKKGRKAVYGSKSWLAIDEPGWEHPGLVDARPESAEFLEATP
jgi:hypothetical protein